MNLWLISIQIVIFYFWFLTKEESCQSALKQLNYFWLKTMQGKMLSPNIKIILPFNRCYLGRPMCYHIVKMLTVDDTAEKYRKELSLRVTFLQFFNKTGDAHLKNVMGERYMNQGEQWNAKSSGQL